MLATFGMSVPGFLLGLVLIFFFAVQLRWFPVVGYRSTNDDFWLNVWYLTLPAIALGLRIAALIARMTRAVMLDVLQEPLSTRHGQRASRSGLCFTAHAQKQPDPHTDHLR